VRVGDDLKGNDVNILERFSDAQEAPDKRVIINEPRKGDDQKALWSWVIVKRP
jgi:hypothetical protein